MLWGWHTPPGAMGAALWVTSYQGGISAWGGDTLWDAGDQHPKTAQSLVWDV